MAYSVTIPMLDLAVHPLDSFLYLEQISLKTMLLETGGTIGQADSTYFKIVKSSNFGYNLLYCPITRPPILCPFCRDDDFCAKVGVVIQKGKRRLALVNENPLDVNFKEV
ncbi:hypothetical protein MTR67_014505 [Solanum verrucosum]|uniref:Uncharacterized protein n=1 Tax=Solanum verrucosum TaxID=315347 RepID=A0AAF0QH00_SOLVR|nr:hypothetical protein MTR67_014505 [Solanum verrucosum]